jgi:tetratricopeptide (TPR) repeat protein
MVPLYLSNLWLRTGEYDKAEELLRRILATRERVQGPSHPDVLDTLVRLSRTLSFAEKFAEGTSVLERVQELVAQGGELSVSAQCSAQANLGRFLYAVGRTAEACTAMDRAVELHAEHLGEHHPMTLIITRERARLLVLVGRTDEALAALETVAADLAASLGQAHIERLDTLFSLAELLGTQGLADQSAPLIDEIADHLASSPAQDPVREAKLRLQLIQRWRACGQAARAKEFAERSLALLRERLPGDAEIIRQIESSALSPLD